ncbi:DUF4296 domain-containing protein [Bacteroides fragilis]|uniref:DUF4296 domain-containing protein n=1 Tax=Bacteroides fragilis TaxID=817 RepID=UPI0022AA862F|nr:DUF4296 domain-containing protein [Bacteroides fragilis]MCE9474340.1 DUF4296 domain-containing protein [Bacteroides fragilis]MCZ2501772.1 DUF4296 domain-containing protein [Bacteroides fragilis]
MKKFFRFQLCCICLLVLIVSACKVKRPDSVISESEMENLLYDYHIAKAMGENMPGGENYKKALYVEAVFKKYGTTEEVFDSSMVWYTRNTKILSEIYEKVNKRLKAQQNAINHLIALRDNKPKMSAPGDSINVWAWQRIAQLTEAPLNNKFTFTLPSDTNFKKRDVLLWKMQYNFLSEIPDSTMAPIMAMQIVYENDTVTHSCVKHIFKSGIQNIRLQSDTMNIKEIKGFIFCPLSEESITLLVSDISLTRYHANDSITQTGRDSLKTDSIKEKSNDDSIQKKTPKDTIQASSPHQRTNPNDLNRPNNDVRPIKPEQREKEMQIEKEKQQLERQQRTNPRRPLRRQNN